jgi:hypothetical protein
MFGAVFGFYWATFRTDQPTSIEASAGAVAFFIHHIGATFPAPKVRFFTFKTLKVSINCHGIICRFLIEI